MVETCSRQLGFSVREICATLELARSTFYRKPKLPNSDRIALEKAVILCFNKHIDRYGRRRIKADLESEGIDATEYIISSILKENGLFAKGGRDPKKGKKTPKPTEEQYRAEMLIPDETYAALANGIWHSDITELRYGRSKKLYVCAILDFATRRIVGHCIAKRQTQDIVREAFLMAVGRNPKRPEGAIFHSDRGCQYTAKRTKELVEAHGFRVSMSRPRKPNDNQPIESFWKTLKTELTDISNLNFEEARMEIVKYIETYYNSRRRHSSIGYMTPNDKFTVLSVQ